LEVLTGSPGRPDAWMRSDGRGPTGEGFSARPALRRQQVGVDPWKRGSFLFWGAVHWFQRSTGKPTMLTAITMLSYAWKVRLRTVRMTIWGGNSPGNRWVRRCRARLGVVGSLKT